MNIVISEPNQKTVDAYKEIKKEAKKNGLTVRLVINRIFERALLKEIKEGKPTAQIGGIK